jgi:hypothetical protein
MIQRQITNHKSNNSLVLVIIHKSNHIKIQAPEKKIGEMLNIIGAVLAA